MRARPVRRPVRMGGLAHYSLATSGRDMRRFVLARRDTLFAEASVTQLACPRRALTGAKARLAADGEVDLLLAARAGDGDARDELVSTFMPLIGGVARRYRNSSSVDRDELMQEGVVGLLRALKRYDSAAGTSFWPYASWWVRQAMQQLIAELARPTVLSDRALRQLAG